eukprot:scaffold1934_cov76-Cyclotella_meneghiniana.AAC.3
MSVPGRNGASFYKSIFSFRQILKTDRVHEDDLKVKDWTNISFERMNYDTTGKSEANRRSYDSSNVLIATSHPPPSVDIT